MAETALPDDGSSDGVQRHYGVLLGRHDQQTGWRARRTPVERLRINIARHAPVEGRIQPHSSRVRPGQTGCDVAPAAGCFGMVGRYGGVVPGRLRGRHAQEGRGRQTRESEKTHRDISKIGSPRQFKRNLAFSARALRRLLASGLNRDCASDNAGRSHAWRVIRCPGVWSAAGGFWRCDLRRDGLPGKREPPTRARHCRRPCARSDAATNVSSRTISKVRSK